MKAYFVVSYGKHDEAVGILFQYWFLCFHGFDTRSYRWRLRRLGKIELRFLQVNVFDDRTLLEGILLAQRLEVEFLCRRVFHLEVLQSSSSLCSQW